MFDDISKILKSITKGVVVMEDGKPAYVVVPFEEYTESMKTRKIEGVRMWADPRQQQLDDATVIQKMIDYDTGARPEDAIGMDEAEIKTLLNSLDREQDDRSPLAAQRRENGIHLEDLPF